MEFTGSLNPVDALALPWDIALDQWPDEKIVALPRGISRHIVRFIEISGKIYAVKELAERVALHEYELLRELRERGLPCVKPVAVITGRSTSAANPDGLLVTKHLPHSLPYRSVFASRPTPETVKRLIDALALLLVRLHLENFAWQDCSLSNTLFRRDAGDFTAYLVDAETGELKGSISPGMRWYDVDTAVTNMAGELMDLQAAGKIPHEVDAVDLALRLRTSYEDIWALLTEPVVVAADDRRQLDGYIRRLNDVGFDVGEIQIKGNGQAQEVTIRAKVVEAGHHSRRLMQLTGLDVQENQARRLLNDIDTFQATHPERSARRTSEHMRIAASRWFNEVFEPTVAAVPVELVAKLAPAEIFHEVLEHRWFLSEREGDDVGMPAAVASYIATVLHDRPDEQTLLPAHDVAEALADEVS